MTVDGTRNGLPEIHLFEPTGYGGVFQHTCQLGLGLGQTGRRVVLHTGHKHEQVHLDGVDFCACSWWPRPSASGRVTAAARKATIVRRLVQHTVPHLIQTAPPGAVLHLQGTAASGALNLLAMTAARRAGLRVVYSPHDAFSRRGRLDGALLRLAYRVPHAIVVQSHADEAVVRAAAGGVDRVHYSPLVQLVPRPSATAEQSWRREWRADLSDTVVLFAGFIRPEKRLDVLIESARHWPPGCRLAIVGPDKGGWARCDALAREYGIDIATRLEFVGLNEFTAAIAAADLVVVPSEKASQSGVLALAQQLRTPTVAADVGGMAELASDTFIAGDVHDLTRAIQAGLASGASPVQPPIEEDHAVHAHLRAYGAPL
jgi:glycosyltransferase involved in cell wall biosynthesis